MQGGGDSVLIQAKVVSNIIQIQRIGRRGIDGRKSWAYGCGKDACGTVIYE